MLQTWASNGKNEVYMISKNLRMVMFCCTVQNDKQKQYTFSVSGIIHGIK
jgi:hypothetical protein